MSVNELVDQVKRALTAIGRARSRLVDAHVALSEARDTWATVTQGTTDPEAGALASSADAACEQLVQVHGGLKSAEATLHAYLAKVAGDAPPRGPSPPTAADPLEGRVEALRRELPPPVARGRGQKTHGRWFAPGGKTAELASGWDELTTRVNVVLTGLGCPRVPPMSSAHVEVKLAMHMRDNGIREATVVINHRPCRGEMSCDTLVPVLLPEGYCLTVYGPGVRKRYTGGAKPWWK